MYVSRSGSTRIMELVQMTQRRERAPPPSILTKQPVTTPSYIHIISLTDINVSTVRRMGLLAGLWPDNVNKRECFRWLLSQPIHTTQQYQQQTR